MSMDINIYKQVGIYIEESRSCLNEEQIEAILEYYKHGEYEMAFEGLSIELISNNSYPAYFSFENWLQVGKECKINLSANFDDALWDRFLKWGQLFQNRLQ